MEEWLYGIRGEAAIRRAKAVRIPVFKELPIKHKFIAIQPMLEKVDIEGYLDSNIDSVVVGGESGSGVRPLHYEWVLDVRQQCINKKVNFDFI